MGIKTYFFRMMKTECYAFLLVLTILLFPSIAHASACMQNNYKKICILEIKRSAKNFWEYRASVSINGVVQPIEKYNCRSRMKTKKDGATIPFEENGAGDFICSFFKKV